MDEQIQKNQLSSIEELQREIIKANRLYSSILESMPVGMVVYEGDPPNIVDCNEKLTKMFGAPKNQIVEKYFEKFMPKYLPDGKITAEEALKMGARAIAGETVQSEWPHQTADGVPLTCEVTLTRVKDEEEFIGLGFLYDKTDMREREKELLRVKEMNELQLTKLNLAIKAAGIGLWDMEIIRDDPVNNVNIIAWSDEFRNLLGYKDKNDFPDVISSFHNCLHPEDFERVTSAITNHMLDTTGKTPYDEEYRVIKKNGDLAYFRATGETIRDKEGNPIRVAGTVIDITEEKNTLINTEKLRLEAEEANKAKSAFLANMSHEIRTPLNAVIGLSDLILGAEILDEESRYRLEQINNAGATLLGTVNDILDISKIEAGKFELVKARYDIPSMINDSVTQSILHRDEKQIEFIMNISQDLPTHLYGDELRIKQILNNLLSNAFKYTLEGTVELSVDCDREGETVWLDVVVKDTGIGISDENIQNLFSDYIQLDVTTNRKIVGTGLGLSIAKRLVEQMDGRITAQSVYGKGSIFTVRIKQQHVTDENIGPEIVESLKSLHYSEHKRQQIGSLTRLNLPYARVLLVDDVVTNLDVAKGLMKPYNMQIDCVTSGWEAVEAMHDTSISYNAIFMDHMMPGMDGVEATRLIREIGTDYARNVPIIALTANAIVGNEEMFIQKGFQAFISKPIEIARLDAVIREWVRDRLQESHSGEEDPQKDREADVVFRTIHETAVPGLEFEKGLKRFRGDIETYRTVLRSFADSTPALLDLLEETSKNKDSLFDYETTIHGVKGSSASVCAEEVSEMAESLEKAANAGDYDYVATHNVAFVETARKLISDIQDMLLLVQEETQKSKRAIPDTETLKRLHDACLNYEMNAMDEAIAELEAYDYESGGELIAWLRQNAEKANFDEIADRLSLL